MDKDIAIKVENVSKTFKIPHEKVSSLRGAAVSLFSKNRGYEEFKALDDVSFEVKKGEFFGIIGRNGSGKSTLLKILAGIYQPDKGKVKINGRISPFLELGIGFNPELSGRDNVYLNATVLGLTKKEIDEKFDSIVKFSELERFIDQKLKNYSSGMQVRLAFSVSIHANREILLMDEVLAVGDNNFQAKCLSEFAKYRDAGKTVILVTHDIATVQRYCNRAMLIRNGKILKIGSAENIGDEYIIQNVSDEENRINNVRQARSLNIQSEAGANIKYKKTVEITKIEFFDESGKIKNSFEAEKNLFMRIFFHVNRHPEEINLGIGLHSSNGNYLLGFNTKIDNYKIDSKSDSVVLCLDKVPLLSGNYSFSFVCFGNSEQEYYDFKPKHKSINIYSYGKANFYRGVLHIKHKWSMGNF